MKIVKSKLNTKLMNYSNSECKIVEQIACNLFSNDFQNIVQKNIFASCHNL